MKKIVFIFAFILVGMTAAFAQEKEYGQIVGTIYCKTHDCARVAVQFELSKLFWNERTFWTDGYFVCSVGNVSGQMLKEYIENQG